MTKKRIVTAIAIVLGSIGAIWLTYSLIPPRIENVEVTNITSNSFSVVWTTNKKTRGSVLTTTNLDTKSWNGVGVTRSYDDRDVEEVNAVDYQVKENTEARYTHHVTVRNQDPEQKFKIAIKNGWKTDTDILDTVSTTPVITQIKSPDPVYGKIVTQEGNPDGIVLFTKTSADGTKSQTLSAYLNEETGTYTFDSQNILTSNLDNAFGESIDDTETIEVYARTGNVVSKDKVDTTTEEDQPVPTLELKNKEDGIQGVSNLISMVYARRAEGDEEVVQEKKDNPKPDVVKPKGGDNDVDEFRRARQRDDDSGGGNEGAPITTSTPQPTEGSGSGLPDENIGQPTVSEESCIGKSGLTLQNCLDSVGSIITPEPTPTGTNEPISPECEGMRGIALELCEKDNNPITNKTPIISPTPSPTQIPPNYDSMTHNEIESFCNETSNSTDTMLACMGKWYPGFDPLTYARDTACTMVFTSPDSIEDCIDGMNGYNSCNTENDFNNRVSCYEGLLQKNPNYSNWQKEDTLSRSKENDVERACKAAGWEDNMGGCMGALYTENLTANCHSSFDKYECYLASIERLRLFNSTERAACYQFGMADGNDFSECLNAIDKTCLSSASEEEQLACYTEKIKLSGVIDGPTMGSVGDPGFRILLPKTDTKDEVVSSKPAESVPQVEQSISPICEQYVGILKNICLDAYPELTLPIHPSLDGAKNNVINNLALGESNQRVLGAGTDEETVVWDAGKYTLQTANGDSMAVDVAQDSIVKFFVDTNGNGVKDTNESFVDNVGELGFSVKKEYEIQKYGLNNGWNLIHIPFVLNGTNGTDYVVKASDLLKSINSQGVYATHVTTYRNGKFLIYSLRAKSNGEPVEYGTDFNILPGEGYFVRSWDVGTFSVTGFPVENSLPVNIVPGWNLVGVFNANKTSYKGFEVLSQMQQDGIQAEVMSKWSDGMYSNLISKQDVYYGNDYNVYPLAGYWVQSKTNGPKVYTPE